MDASVAAKWFLNEPHTAEARRLLQPERRLYAPDYFLVEMDGLLARRVRRGHYAPDDARAVRAILGDYPIQYVRTAVVRDTAFEMAIELGRSVYDCLYLALALRLGCPVATADRRFCDAVAGGPLGEHIVWVGDL